MVALILLPGMDGTGLLFQPFIKEISDAFNVRVVQPRFSISNRERSRLLWACFPRYFVLTYPRYAEKNTAKIPSQINATSFRALMKISVQYPTTEALGYAALERIALQILPDNEPFLLLGESFSGPIAISIAAAHPTGLVGLILCSTFAVNPRPSLSKFRLLATALPPKLAPIAMLDHMLLGRHSTKDLRLALASAVTQVSSAAFSARLHAIHSVNVLQKLKSISAPVLYLQATEDKVVPPTALAIIKAQLPAIRIASFAAPHCLLQATPRAAASVIQAFSNEIH